MANQEIDSLSKSCSISGCTGKYKAKGFCGRHLQQIYQMRQPAVHGVALHLP